MNKIKIPVSRTEDFEVEVELPLYRKLPSGQYYYAIFDRDTIIMVNTNSLEISKSYFNAAYLFREIVDTTKEDFDQAFNTVLLKIQDILKHGN